MFVPMISVEIKRAVLKYLYEKYLSDSGTIRHDIRKVTDGYNEQARKTGLYLLNRVLIGNQRFSEDGAKSSILTILNKINDTQGEDRKVRLQALKKEIAKGQTSSEGSFSCSITMLGIKEVAPEYIIENTKTIITTLGKTGGLQNLNEILQQNLNDYRKASDLALYLQALGYLTAENSGTNVFAELTFFGKERYEINKNKPSKL
jgi:hypothetical protein